MTLNVIGSFDVKKPGTLDKPFIEFLFFKICFFVQKNRPNNIGCYMLKITKKLETCFTCSVLVSIIIAAISFSSGIVQNGVIIVLTRIYIVGKKGNHSSRVFQVRQLIFWCFFCQLFDSLLFLIRSKQYEKCPHSWLFKNTIWKLINTKQINVAFT